MHSFYAKQVVRQIDELKRYIKDYSTPAVATILCNKLDGVVKEIQTMANIKSVCRHCNGEQPGSTEAWSDLPDMIPPDMPQEESVQYD